MKKDSLDALCGIIVMTISLLMLVACNSVKSSSSTATANPITAFTTLTSAITQTEAADDLVFVPAGVVVYRTQINVKLKRCKDMSEIK